MSHKQQENADNCLTALLHIETQEQIVFINLEKTIKLNLNTVIHIVSW